MVQPEDRRRSRQRFILSVLDVCPHLRLVGDQDTHAAYARPDHACGRLGTEPIPTDWQQRHCLSADFVECPAYQGNAGTLASEFAEKRTRRQQMESMEDVAAAPRERSQYGSGGVLIALIALTALFLVAGGAVVASQGGWFDDVLSLWNRESENVGGAPGPIDTPAMPTPTEEPTDDPSTPPAVADEPEPAPSPALQPSTSSARGSLFAYDAFEAIWQRTDYPVRQGRADRAWVWGDAPVTGSVLEAWEDWPEGERATQYFAKGRMELDGAIDDPGQVKIGLLAIEMAEGFLRIGSDTLDFSPDPADIQIAGDNADGAFPTYAEIIELGLTDASPHVALDATITQTLAGGEVFNAPAYAAYQVTAAYVIDIPAREHMIASVFWDYMIAEGVTYQGGGYFNARLFPETFDVTGLPITEPYWTTAQVDGETTDVLWQCFERRCLLYFPDNEPGQQVQSSDTGLHYYQWRYGSPPD